MDNNLYFSVSGKINDMEITPENFTLPVIIELAESMNKFIKGSTRISSNDFSVSIRRGSLAISAHGGESLAAAITDYNTVRETGSFDKIDPIRAKVLKSLQQRAQKSVDSDFVFTISDSDNPNIYKYNNITLSRDGSYKTSNEDVWAETNIYEYGTIVDMGGKTKSNVHLVLEDGSTIVLNAEMNQLANDKRNRLYQKQLVSIRAEQNLETGKIRNERLESFLEYNPKFVQGDFDRISKQVERSWADVPNISRWVEELRGNYAQVA